MPFDRETLVDRTRAERRRPSPLPGETAMRLFWSAGLTVNDLVKCINQVGLASREFELSMKEVAGFSQPHSRLRTE